MNRQYVNKIFEEELNFDNAYESFCYQNCLKILLQAKKIKNSWLYINSCTSMIYSGFLQLNCHRGVRGLIPRFQDKVKRINETRSTKEVFYENCEYISTKDEALITGVDTYYLPYASNYKKNHAKHTLILCGYDFNSNIVYVIDWYTPWFFKGTISISEFLKARESLNEYDGTIYSGDPIQNNWACINYIPEEELIPHAAIKDVILESINKYYSSCDNIGAQALKHLKNDLIFYVQHNYDKQVITKLYKSLFLIAKRHNFYLSYLENSKSLFGYDFSSLILSQKQIISKWDSFLMILLKFSVSASEKTVQRFNCAAEELIELETNYSKAIAEFSAKNFY